MWGNKGQEEFQRSIKMYETEISLAQKEIERCKKDYILKNQKYEIGEKVYLRKPNKPIIAAVVYGYKIKHGYVFPVLKYKNKEGIITKADINYKKDKIVKLK